MKLLLFLLFAVFAFAQQVPPSDLNWQPMEVRNIETAPSTTPTGNHALYVRATQTQRLPMHAHPNDVTITTMSGDVMLYEAGSQQGRKLNPSEPVTIPAGQPHELALNKDAQIKIVSDQPVTWKWANPKALKKKGKDVESVSDRTKEKREQDKP